MSRHKLLTRQLSTLKLDDSSVPSAEAWKDFIARINRAYNDFDQERYLLERSLHLSSKELQDRWDALQLQKAASMQASKMATLGEMAGGIAHEINTPLATIYLLSEQICELAEDNPPGLDDIKNAANKIEFTAKRIAKIVHALRTFSRQSDKEPLSKVPFQTIVNDTLAMCGEKFRSHGVFVKLEVDPELQLSCRPVQIEQVLLNLLNNAFDAITGTKEAWITVACQKQDNHIILTVTDSGKGIAEGIASRLMEPFFTTKEIGKGTGLGLSISKGIIESHGGTIELDVSHPNTRFVIKLPDLSQTQLDPAAAG